MSRSNRIPFQPRSSRTPLPNPGLVGPGGRVIDTTPPVMLDGYGRELAVGDGVTLHVGRPPIFRITKLEPLNDPQAPPGAMDIVVSCTLRFITPRAVPQQEFLLAMTVEEMTATFNAPAPLAPPAQEAVTQADGDSGEGDAAI